MPASQPYREQKHHGAAQFPFNIYPCTIPKDFSSVPLHWQDSMELIFVKKGAGVVRAGAALLPAAARDIFVFPPGTLHGLEQAPGPNAPAMEYENVIFDLDLLGGADDLCTERYLLPLKSGRLPLPARLRPGAPAYDRAAACLHEAEEASRTRGAGYELAVKGALQSFLAAVIAQQGAQPAAGPDNARLNRALQFVVDRSAEAITVADAAAYCGCSPSHFMRWFKKMTGRTFVAFLNDHRLAVAAEALRTTDVTVLAAAENAGFGSLSYFNRQFKRKYAATPHEYRKGR